MTNTIIVVRNTSRRVGQTTFETSERTCWINWAGFVTAFSTQAWGWSCGYLKIRQISRARYREYSSTKSPLPEHWKRLCLAQLTARLPYRNWVDDHLHRAFNFSVPQNKHKLIGFITLDYIEDFSISEDKIDPSNILWINETSDLSVTKVISDEEGAFLLSLTKPNGSFILQTT